MQDDMIDRLTEGAEKWFMIAIVIASKILIVTILAAGMTRGWLW